MGRVAVFGRRARGSMSTGPRQGHAAWYARITLAAAIVVSGSSLITSGVQGQSGLRSFLGTTAAQMDDADWQLLRTAALDVLNDPGTNASKSWHNSANDHHGTVTSLKSFDSPEGRPCKRLRLDNSAGGQQGTVSYNVCQSTDGKWRIDS